MCFVTYLTVLHPALTARFLAAVSFPNLDSKSLSLFLKSEISDMTTILGTDQLCFSVLKEKSIIIAQSSKFNRMEKRK